MNSIKKAIAAVTVLTAIAFTQPVHAQGNDLMSIMQRTMQDMQAMQPTGDPDNDFAMMLRRHHQGAIEMAQLQISNGKDATLKALSRKMIAEQTKDNKELDAFLSSHSAHGNSDFGQKAKSMMAPDMNMSMTGDIDKDFAAMMIHHHTDGIKMAKEYLKSGKEKKMVQMASKNIKSQTEDIKKLTAKTGKTTGAKKNEGHTGHQH